MINSQNIASASRDGHSSSDAAAVILGGYVNGYGVIRSLHEAGVSRIYLIDTQRMPARLSRYLTDSFLVTKVEDIPAKLTVLGSKEKYLVLYPTADHYLEMIVENASALEDFCFIPANVGNLHDIIEKPRQYQAAAAAGVAVPKSLTINSIDELSDLCSLSLPVLIKPATRVDIFGVGFRNLVIDDYRKVNRHKPLFKEVLDAGCELLASEVIPGGDLNIYAYTAYVDKSGKILREWTGKKLSQYPDAFGMYSAASTATDSVLTTRGRAVLAELDCYGLCQAEFKLDPRDGEYKLMEVNLRSDMWHRVGAMAGVNLPEAQWRDALGLSAAPATQSNEKVTHLYFAHEISNLIARRGYCRRFFKHLRHGKREWAFWNISDPLPFFASVRFLIRLVGKACLKRSKLL